MFPIQRYGEVVPEVVIDLKTDGSLGVAGSREEVEIEETLSLILQTLEEGPLSEQEVVGRVEKRHILVTKSLRTLMERDDIIRTGTGKKGDPFSYKRIDLPIPVLRPGRREENLNARITP